MLFTLFVLRSAVLCCQSEGIWLVQSYSFIVFSHWHCEGCFEFSPYSSCLLSGSERESILFIPHSDQSLSLSTFCSLCRFIICVPPSPECPASLNSTKINCNCLHYHNHQCHSYVSVAVMTRKTIIIQNSLPVTGLLIYGICHFILFHSQAINCTKLLV